MAAMEGEGRGDEAERSVPLVDDEPVTVFVSYSWDSTDHQTWVRHLADHLQSQGLEVLLDVWFVRAGDSITEFMEKACRTADVIVVVCTPDYVDRSDNRRGGAGYEGQILSARMLEETPARVIPVLAGPTGGTRVIPTFLAMYMADFSLNLITLLALSLVVGILVDDAIVEIENISRHLQMAKSPLDAAL